MAMLMQIFFPCYYGSEILAVSENLSTSLFHSDWIGTDQKFQSAMRIFMERAKRAKKIFIFGVFEVNLETFTLICRSAYSLYAVLKTMGA